MTNFIRSDTEWQWTLDGHYGEIAFRSVGFKQYVRTLCRFERLRWREH